MEQEYYDAFSEVYVILQQMQKENLDKIPSKFIKFIEENRNKDYLPDLKNNLLENVETLKKETRIILGIIYKDFFCKNQINTSNIEETKQFNYEDLFLEKKEIPKKVEDKTEILDIESEKLHIKFVIKIKRIIIEFIRKISG